jgi:hypothetical protein
MIRKAHFLLALALAAAAIGVPVAQAEVKSPYEFLGHPTGLGGVDRVSTAAVSAAAVKSPYEFLGHPTSQGGVGRVSVAAVSAVGVKSPYEFLGHPTGQDDGRVAAAAVKSPYEFLGHPAGVDRVSVAAGRPIGPLAASASSPQVGGSTVFQWGDAGIGAGFTLGIVILAGAGLLITRQNRHQQSGHASPRSS